MRIEEIEERIKRCKRWRTIDLVLIGFNTAMLLWSVFEFRTWAGLLNIAALNVGWLAFHWNEKTILTLEHILALEKMLDGGKDDA